MTVNEKTIRAVFFDIGDTLGVVRLSAPPVRVERIEVKPGVAEALREISSAGVRRGIISDRGNVPEAEVLRALEGCGLGEFFDPTLIVFGRKDSAEIFRRAAGLAPLDPRDCMFVGESVKEREHAAAAGMKVATTPPEAARAVRGSQTHAAEPGGLAEPFEFSPDTDGVGEEARAEFAAVVAAIEERGEELLMVPGVVAVRPGYRFVGGRITGEPAVSVSVLEKREAASVPPEQLLPPRLGDIPVDVVPASPLEQLGYFGVAGAAGLVETTPPGAGDAEESAAAFAPLQPYVPPGEPLDPVEEEMTVVCHASPDAGWRNLREFLSGTRRRLTATMYEFTARHVLDALVAALGDGRRMDFILDAGHQDVSAGDVSKEEVRRALGAALGGRFRFAWAAVGDDSVTTAAFFRNAYHIKVAVRDGESFWLSSGNWKRSGQPVIDPIHGPLPPNFDAKRFQ
ncbi:MAG: HAD family hydrolase, partial [Pyrinomonadaceae bacterium]